MKTVSVKKILSGQQAIVNYFHQSGKIIAARNSVFRANMITAFEESGVTELFIPESEQENEILPELLNMNKIDAYSLKPGARIDYPIYDRKKVKLLNANVVLTSEIIEKIRSRDNYVYTAGNPDTKKALRQFHRYERILAELDRKTPADIEEIIVPEEDVRAAQIIDTELLADPQNVMIYPSDVPFMHSVSTDKKFTFRSKSLKKEVTEDVENIMKNASGLFGIIRNHEAVEMETADRIISDILELLERDKEIMHNALALADKYPYLFSHSVGVAILSIIIGMSSRFSRQDLYELGMGALLHNIGMLKIPDQLVNKRGSLSERDIVELKKHATLGINILEKQSSLPRVAPYIAYQSHERPSGTGYPNQRTHSQIHDLAKIVSISDVYSALCQERPYRQAYKPYDAVRMLLKMARSGLLDRAFLRGFLEQVSLFPVGSLVHLNNNGIAKVIAANPEDYTRPVVTLIIRDKRPVTPPRMINLMEDRKIRITGTIDCRKYKLNPLFGF